MAPPRDPTLVFRTRASTTACRPVLSWSRRGGTNFLQMAERVGLTRSVCEASAVHGDVTWLIDPVDGFLRHRHSVAFQKSDGSLPSFLRQIREHPVRVTQHDLQPWMKRRDLGRNLGTSVSRATDQHTGARWRRGQLRPEFRTTFHRRDSAARPASDGDDDVIRLDDGTRIEPDTSGRDAGRRVVDHDSALWNVVAQQEGGLRPAPGTCSELVQPDAVHEVRIGIHQRDVGMPAEPPGYGHAGIPGTNNDDAGLSHAQRPSPWRPYG